MRLLTVGWIAFVVGCNVDYDLNADDPGSAAPDDARSVTDGFVQLGELEALDVLVVLDTSGSMTDDAETVGEGMLQLKQAIDDTASWWSFTFITADPARLGPQGPYVMGATTDIDLLMAPSLLPASGGERGFGASYVHLRDNPGILTPDADLLIFLISDEDEQSGISAELYDEWLTELETGARRTDVVSIVSTSTGCSPDIGQKYMDLAAIRGKRAVDLCEEDWSAFMSELSFLTGRRDRVLLSEEPIEGTIEVALDGVTIDGWTYEHPLNAVVLDAVPEAGVEVTVSYLTLP